MESHGKLNQALYLLQSGPIVNYRSVVPIAFQRELTRGRNRTKHLGTTCHLKKRISLKVLGKIPCIAWRRTHPRDLSTPPQVASSFGVGRDDTRWNASPRLRWSRPSDHHRFLPLLPASHFLSSCALAMLPSSNRICRRESGRSRSRMLRASWQDCQNCEN